ncbi:MAG: putative bifunctional diguanylate cyclase/phosphodiesterase [Spirochaetaceae bacterium]
MATRNLRHNVDDSLEGLDELEDVEPADSPRDDTDEFALKRSLAVVTQKFRGLQDDHTRLKEHLTDLENIVNLDPTTGLPIRRVLFRALSKILAGDSLKDVVDSLPQSAPFFLENGNGRHYTDRPVTRLLAGVIRLGRDYRKIRSTRDRDNILLFKTVVRVRSLTGPLLFQSDRSDEFVFLVPEPGDLRESLQYSRSIADVVAQPHEPPADDLTLAAHIGFARYPEDADSLDTLLEYAHAAVDRSEDTGSIVVPFSRQLGEERRRRQHIERAVREAIADDFVGFHLVYQPIVSPDGTLVAAETLVRFEHAELGRVSPAVFIPILEENGDIRLLGQWILFQACRTIRDWHDEGFTDMRLSVNLSPAQFLQPDITRRIEATMRAVGIQPKSLKIELTETMVMNDPGQTIQAMQELRKLGVSLLIDDFGTGYSSLAYLRQLPVDTLKIDKSFVDDLCDDVSNKAIIQAIVTLGSSLGLKTLAEGVEHECQLEVLKAVGCDLIQGYYFSGPVDGDLMKTYLKNGRVAGGT